MKKRNIAIIVFISIFITIPLAFAGPADILEGPFSTLLEIVKNDVVTFGFTVIFFFMLLYGIFAGAMRFIPVFKDDKGVSRQGKVVAIALSGLSTLAAFYAVRPRTPQAILQSFLEPFGIFAGLTLAALFAGITYFGISGAKPDSKSFALAATAAGLGIMLATSLALLPDNAMAWGSLLLLIAFIFGILFRNWGSGKRDDSYDPSTTLPSTPGQPSKTPPPSSTPDKSELEATTAKPQIRKVDVDDNNIKIRVGVE